MSDPCPNSGPLDLPAPRTILVLGARCPRCDRLLASVNAILTRRGDPARAVKLTDLDSLFQYRISALPALVIDGVVRSVGRVPRPDEIEAWLDASPDRGQTG